MFKPSYPQRKRTRRCRIKGRKMQLPLLCHKEEVKCEARRITAHVEPLLSDNAHGWRPRRSVQTAVGDIQSRVGSRLKFDIETFFDSIDQDRLRRQLNRLDPTLWPAIAPWMPSSGLPTGFSFSPVLANLYFSEIDARFPEAVRYADNVLIVAADPAAVFRRMQRQLNDIGLRCHEVELDPTTFCKSPL